MEVFIERNVPLHLFQRCSYVSAILEDRAMSRVLLGAHSSLFTGAKLSVRASFEKDHLSEELDSALADKVDDY